MESFVVPDCITEITVSLLGASDGGSGLVSGSGSTNDGGNIGDGSVSISY